MSYIFLALTVITLAVWPLAAWFYHSRQSRASAQWRPATDGLPTAQNPRSAAAVTQRGTAAIGWNAAVIVVGALIALIGLINGLAVDPVNSAFRQTVAALWVIQGILGLLIAAVGVLGATLVHALHYDQQPGG